MEGTAENRGVNYRTLEELFRVSKRKSDTMRYELSVSILEIYNEEIRDLLDNKAKQPANKLKVEELEVPGLTEVRVLETGDVWKLLESGREYVARSVGSTANV
ncbi:P-loop containing nucleoside triphosphate hydrolase superfamily protein [Tanacetum coccineum]|uniref:P-loop containing nucleoside triphosphate hydrolase superfamily protein n=1 Tax=Tanacetum coccineum TaxID=301880 RepID=A0ABQ5AH02_9ASTR